MTLEPHWRLAANFRALAKSRSILCSGWDDLNPGLAVRPSPRKKPPLAMRLGAKLFPILRPRRAGRFRRHFLWEGLVQRSQRRNHRQTHK
jgi:hypothetical protein